MIRLVATARATTALGLLALVIFGLPRAPAPGEALLLDLGTPPDTVAAILARERAPTLRWLDSLPPGTETTALMAAAAGQGGAVTMALPDRAGRLRLEAPDRPVAGRRASLRVGVRADPETEVPVTVEGPGGGVDTVRVATGPDGRGTGAVALEASREGAASWTVRSPDATAVVHAWVRPAAPVRVLVWGEAPASESRTLIRALEAAGMEVDVLQGLGRGLAVASRGVAAPGTLDDLEPYDVLALVGSPSRGADDLALRWVRERGGGLLLLGPVAPGSPLTPWAPSGPAADRAASELEWVGPAEIVPLPGAEILTRTAAVPPGGVPVAQVGAGPVAHLAALGRGRLFASGFESWPWVMRAGLVSEHRAFWESVLEWLAGGLREETILVAEPAWPRTRWEGRFEGEAPEGVVLAPATPGGAPPEELPTVDRPDGTAAVAFVPTAAGPYRLRTAATEAPDDPSATFGVVAVGPGEDRTWTDAARRIGGSGGRVVSSPGVAPADRALPGAFPDGARSPGRPRVLPWVLFLALGGISVAGWTLRRVRGLP